MSQPSYPLPEQLLSFEMRMRQRRATRCLQRATAAIESGDIAAAESAVQEARELHPDSPELSNIEARLTAASTSIETTGHIDVVDGSAVTSHRGLTPWIAAATGFAVLATGAAFGARSWLARYEQRNPPPAVDALPPLPAVAAAAAAVAPATQLEQPLRVIYETVRAPEITPRLIVAEPRLPAYPGPPIAEPEPQLEPEPVVLAINRGENNPPPPILQTQPEFRGETRLEPVAPPAPSEPPARAAAPPPDTVALPETRTTPPPAPEEAPITRDESSVVRSVLRQYESAFSRLDADEASKVWPAVDRGELARAFNGLTSQRVALGSCDVTVNGLAARAVCSGSFTWEPKVGGGVRTEPRRWNFDLRKNGDAWRIERATAR